MPWSACGWSLLKLARIPSTCGGKATDAPGWHNAASMPMCSDAVKANGVWRDSLNPQEWRGFVYTKSGGLTAWAQALLPIDGAARPDTPHLGACNQDRRTKPVRKSHTAWPWAPGPPKHH